LTDETINTISILKKSKL